VPPRGDSPAFEAEVDDVQERNRALHEKAQQLEERLQPLESRAAALRDELAPLSAEWAYDLHRSLDDGLQRARRTLADFQAATAADLENLGREAEEAIADLEEVYQRARRDVETRRSGLGATPAAPR
jgi:chromosome segregation ATPase